MDILANVSKETGILYTPENIGLIDDGWKTETRRVANHKHMDFVGGINDRNDPSAYGFEDGHGEFHCLPERGKQPANGDIQCVFGRAGDLIYIKEAHYLYGFWVKSGKPCGKVGMAFFRDTSERVRFLDDLPEEILTGREPEQGWYKRSPLFMAKKDARKWQVIKSITVERLQDVTPSDCKAEGAPEFSGLPVFYARGEQCYVDWYRNLWESINGPGSWALNPWVWVIKFQKIATGGKLNMADIQKKNLFGL